MNDSLPCKDCRVDTRAIGHYYMVEYGVWEAAHAADEDREGYLCVPCLETRLGRTLNADDFSLCPLNAIIISEQWNEDSYYGEVLRDRIMTGMTPEWMSGFMSELVNLLSGYEPDLIPEAA